MYGTLTSKGQITLPKALREKLGLHQGDKIEFIEKEGEFVLVPMTHSLSDLKGILPRPRKKVTIEEMNEAIRQGPLDDRH